MNGKGKYKCDFINCTVWITRPILHISHLLRYPRWIRWSPIGAGEWKNSRSSYLTRDPCWTLVTGCYKDGDVAAGDTPAHVAIVTGRGTTTSAATYRVVRNDWGFRSGQTFTPTFWRYTCWTEIACHIFQTMYSVYLWYFIHCRMPTNIVTSKIKCPLTLLHKIKLYSDALLLIF